MQAFSVRQLKSNPSKVLKAAQSDAMALVTSHHQPTALVVALDRPASINDHSLVSAAHLCNSTKARQPIGNHLTPS
jgi:antitoxin (DNA-binding transcriptional repressor) of toxin-antitoxin stability system